MKSFLVASLLLVFSQLSAQKASDIEGLWLTANRDSHVLIFKDGAKYSGKIVWLKDPLDASGQPQKDDNGKPILNMKFMTGFELSSGGKYENGKVYDPESGKTYYGSMTLENRNVLKLRGSLDSSGWLGRTETWSRVGQ